eukprot:6177531-Pleurochrysis_carterae.AAC.4
MLEYGQELLVAVHGGDGRKSSQTVSVPKRSRHKHEARNLGSRNTPWGEAVQMHAALRLAC